MKCWKKYLSHRTLSTEDGRPYPQKLDVRFQRMIGNDPELLYKWKNCFTLSI